VTHVARPRKCTDLHLKTTQFVTWKSKESFPNRKQLLRLSQSAEVGFHQGDQTHDRRIGSVLHFLIGCFTTDILTQCINISHLFPLVYIQGCQMVSFQTKNPNVGKFWRALDWKLLIYFMAVRNILQTFDTFYYQLVHFALIWYIFLVWVSCTKKNLSMLLVYIPF
jgi:hypothetical protein